MEIANNSKTMIKRNGESGLPLQTPRLMLKDGVKKPLLATLLITFLQNVFIHNIEGHPTTDFRKISVGRSKYCLEFSFA